MLMKLMYFICCILQPICLPVPEMATVLWGSYSIGAVPSFVIGVIGSVLGIAIMYDLSRKASQKMIAYFKCETKIKKFQHYVERYKVLIIGFFFVVPVLPDEIICIGAPVVGIEFSSFIVLAFLSKCISIGLVSFSKEFASICNLNSIQIVLIELVIMGIAASCFKRVNQKAERLDMPMKM